MDFLSFQFILHFLSYYRQHLFIVLLFLPHDSQEASHLASFHRRSLRHCVCQEQWSGWSDHSVLLSCTGNGRGTFQDVGSRWVWRCGQSGRKISLHLAKVSWSGLFMVFPAGRFLIEQKNWVWLYFFLEILMIIRESQNLLLQIFITLKNQTFGMIVAIDNNFTIQPENITILLGFNISVIFLFAFIVINVKDALLKKCWHQFWTKFVLVI